MWRSRLPKNPLTTTPTGPSGPIRLPSMASIPPLPDAGMG